MNFSCAIAKFSIGFIAGSIISFKNCLLGTWICIVFVINFKAMSFFLTAFFIYVSIFPASNFIYVVVIPLGL